MYLTIKGVCLHHDGGAFGAAVPLAVWARRLEILKKLGVNAIRTAHNPPAPEFLDLTDHMGFLVMDEMFDSWTVGRIQVLFSDWTPRNLPGAKITITASSPGLAGALITLTAVP